MLYRRHLIDTKTTRGRTVEVGGLRVTPIVRHTRLGRPGGWGGAAWARPVAIETRIGGGHVDLVKIPDPGSWIRLAVLALAVILLISTNRAKEER